MQFLLTIVQMSYIHYQVTILITNHHQVRILVLTEEFAEPCQTSKMEHFAKIINGL